MAWQGGMDMSAMMSMMQTQDNSTMAQFMTTMLAQQQGFGFGGQKGGDGDGGKGAWGGKGGKDGQWPPKKKGPPSGDAGIVGLCAAMQDALAPTAHLEPDMSIQDLAFKVCGYVGKTASKYWGAEDDTRFTSKCSMVKAQAIIEEFVTDCMHAIAAGCSEKPWFAEANLTDGLVHAVTGTFVNKQAAFLQKCPKPILQKTVDDTVARYREEERIQRGLWDAVSASGLDKNQKKKCFQHLQSAYDRAHMQAAFGSTTCDPAEFGLVQDFVKCWMEDFVGRAHYLLSDGVSPDAEEQYAFLTTLFQHLSAPEQCCLPFELVSQPGAMPPDSWEYIAELSLALTKAQDEGPKKKKRRTGGGGYGGGENGDGEGDEEAGGYGGGKGGKKGGGKRGKW